MSQTDSVNHERTEDNGNAEDKTVPVSEAIRYRKRAQQAEKQLAELAESLSQERQHAAELDAQLAAQQRQQTLREMLTAAGATDLETTLLLAQTRLDADKDADVAEVVEELRSRKAHLFAPPAQEASPGKTAGVRCRADGRRPLAAAATQAAESGRRADMQAYLRMRRAYVQ